MGFQIISLGLLGLAIYAARLAWLASASQRWPTTAGRMLYSSMSQGEGKQPSRAYVHYSYVVNGVVYDSKRLRFGLFPQGDPYEFGRLHSRGTLRVHYDPRKPSRACLLTGMNQLTFVVPFLLLILSLLFMAADYAGSMLR
jgi:hypothetical protein